VHHGLWLDPQERVEIHAILFQVGSIRDRDITLLDVSDDIRHCLYSAEVVRFEEESYVISTFIDATERKKAEQVLREAEERYRLIADSAHDTIVIIQDLKL